MSATAGIEKTATTEDDLGDLDIVNAATGVGHEGPKGAELSTNPLKGIFAHYVVVKNKAKHQITVFQSHALPLAQLVKLHAKINAGADSAGVETTLDWATREQRMTRLSIPARQAADAKTPSAVFRTNGPIYITVSDGTDRLYHCVDYQAKAGDTITVAGDPDPLSKFQLPPELAAAPVQGPSS